MQYPKYLKIILIAIAAVLLIVAAVATSVGLFTEREDAWEPIPTGEFGEQLVLETEKFQIIYFSETESFLITILQSPFSSYRAEAEQAFLKELSINEKQACSLTVTIVTPAFVSPEHAGVEYPLSFC